jgi:hypothetical protein
MGSDRDLDAAVFRGITHRQNKAVSGPKHLRQAATTIAISCRCGVACHGPPDHLDVAVPSARKITLVGGPTGLRTRPSSESTPVEMNATSLPLTVWCFKPAMVPRSADLKQPAANVVGSSTNTCS